jgi:carboxypeptidase PM20D1
MMKRVLIGIAGLVLLLVAVLVGNTLRQGSRQINVPVAPPLTVDEKGVADRLAGSLRFKTISSLDDPNLNAEEFTKFHAYLEQRPQGSQHAQARVGGWA